MLHIRQTDDTLTRVIGSGLSTAVPLIIGLMAGNMRIGTFGALGAFAFLSFQPFTPTKLATRILKAGLAIMAGFLAGALSTFVPWMIPITISLVSLIGFLVVRILHIPNPGAFFVIMVTSMGAGVRLDIPGMLQAVSFVGIGVAASIFWAVLAVIFNNRVLNRPYRNDTRSYREHLYDAVENDSELLLSSVHHAGILFLATYLAHSLGIGNFYWVAVSCAAVLQGRELKVIFHRHVQRIVGGMVGLGHRNISFQFAFQHGGNGRGVDRFELFCGICDGAQLRLGELLYESIGFAAFQPVEQRIRNGFDRIPFLRIGAGQHRRLCRSRIDFIRYGHVPEGTEIGP